VSGARAAPVDKACLDCGEGMVVHPNRSLCAPCRVKRRRLRQLRPPGPPSKTFALPALRRLVRQTRVAELGEEPVNISRPATRGDCGIERPCPFVGCKYHLYLEVNPETGSIKLNFPHLEVWELKETCSLDVADREAATLEEVGKLMNITKERIRQVEVRGLIALKARTTEEAA
jgi:hypothetical protein